ncbi:YigZ family protein [bacterium BFN5]|nr:YigZ family protein [bacterium BFN5]QJW49125.1 YigZ family protein [bacterium BFN5]
MLNHYKTVKSLSQAELEITKSRFLAYINQAKSETQALDFIDSIKKQHPAAAHHCSAYLIGENDQIQRADDDGEPTGTAGKPILEVIKKNMLKDTVIVITRYFGGIKLGAGGLIRAYGKAASAAIEAADVIEKRLHDRIAIDIEYSILGQLENFLHSCQLRIESKEFTDRVRIIAFIPKDYDVKFIKDLTELTAAQAKTTLLGQQYLDFPL